MKHFLSKFKIYFFIFLVYFPILIIWDWDFWDGVSIDFAFRINDSMALHTLYSELGIPFQYYINEFLLFFSHLVGSFRIVYSIAVYVVVAFLFNSSLNVFNIVFNNKKIAAIGAFALVTFPAFHIVVSSVMFFHLFCFSLFMYAYSLLFQKKYFYFAIPVLFLSLQLNSLITLNYSLLLLLILQRRNFDKNNKYEYITLFFIPIIYYIVKMFIFKPYGLYVGYNSVKFHQLLEWTYIKKLVKYFYMSLNHFWFYTYFLVLVVSICSYFSKVKPLQKLFEILISLSMIFLSLLPYILAEKPPISYVNDWDHRQGMLMALGFGYMVALIYRYFSQDYLNKKLQFIILLIVTLNGVFLNILNWGWWIRAREDHLISQQLVKLEIPHNSYIEYLNPLANRVYRYYETSYLLGRAKQSFSYYSYGIRNIAIRKSHPKYYKQYVIENFIESDKCFRIEGAYGPYYTILNNIMSFSQFILPAPDKADFYFSSYEIIPNHEVDQIKSNNLSLLPFECKPL